ncbi:cyclic pyranopterin monophosphate synthase MoaC [Candidatus Magnetaquicoccus inordinatus]|uniref:cyclic pyranopterin monophosphate synthase MoaC n=1 Tax=Candidatus Magnetaquicoccus inordinatus TaxID=2496818 RepID=UPI00102C2B43|nr:cyclic pyranopterin monophosphate synthase MoaC [Candidatus Magnetaquicoccus inordinatus]
MSDSSPLTHFDAQGATRMVDVSAKEATDRLAIAAGEVVMLPETLQLILNRQLSKGDVLEVARIAGIMAAKRVDMLIPLCHQLNLTSVKIAFEADPEHNRILITAQVRTHGQTGVEMEALTAVSVSALTIYDMCKAVDRGMHIGAIRLLEKSGGKSGHFLRNASC